MKGKVKTMKLKNKELQKMINKANLYELENRLEYLTTEDMDKEGYTEEGYVLREVEWIIEDFEDEAHCLNDELTEARYKLRRTNNGKRIPIDIYRGFKPQYGYDSHSIQLARNIVNEYNRTKRFAERLRKYIEAKEG